MTLFRCSCHALMIEKGRHLNICREERLCNVCNVVDDEKHALFYCIKHTIQRKKYLPEIVYNNDNFISLLQSDNKIIIMNLARFIFTILKTCHK